jgi:hypothetical protein
MVRKVTNGACGPVAKLLLLAAFAAPLVLHTLASATEPGGAAGEADGGLSRVPVSAGCQPPFDQRKARPSDMVCVTRESFATVQDENASAPSRWDSSGAYGPQTCISGLVWREAFDGQPHEPGRPKPGRPQARDLSSRGEHRSSGFGL